MAHVFVRGIEYAALQSRTTKRLYEPIAERYYRWKYSRELSKYDVPVAPFSLRQISPDDIIAYSSRVENESEEVYDIGAVQDGEWDLQRKPKSLFEGPTLEETVLYESMAERFRHGVPWEGTELYQAVVERVTAGEKLWHGCSSVSDVEERCQYLDRLYHTLQEEGYKTQDELQTPRPSVAEPFGYLNKHLLEICVDISRNGQFLLVDSRHRATLARLMNLEEIPVQVITRHKDWMEHMESRYQSGTVPDHPDFKDCRTA